MKYIQHKYAAYGIRDVGETVKTIEKIAASKMYHLRKRLLVKQQYQETLLSVMRSVLQFYEASNQHPLCRVNKFGNRVLIIIGEDAGLVGGLHHALATKYGEVQEVYARSFFIGKSVDRYVGLANEKIDTMFVEINDSPEDIEKVIRFFCDGYINQKYREVDIVYSRFESFAVQTPILIPFLPCDFTTNQPEYIQEVGVGLPIFEPSKRRVFGECVELYSRTFFSNIRAEAKLSELAARTVAMEHAGTQAEKRMRREWRGYVKEHHRAVTQQQLASFNVHQLLS